MAEEQKESGGAGDGNGIGNGTGEGQHTQDTGRATSVPPTIPEGEAVPTLTQAHTTTAATPPPPNIGPLHRSGTLPTRRPHTEAEDVLPDTRRRGRTISARPGNLEARELSPRSRILNRRSPAGRATDNHAVEDTLGSIPERGIPPSGGSVRRRARGSTNSIESPNFVSPGMRPRMSTWASSNLARGASIRRRPTVSMGSLGLQQGISSGRDMDNQSMNFTLAGANAPQEAVVASNLPYVDPGYADLNPAYDQPLNTRPVWGLAKPLPRVLRPGMVPTKSELRVQIPEQQQQQDAENLDLEQGRIEPTFKLNRVTTQLQNAREQRENRLVQTFSRKDNFSPTSLRRPSLAEGSIVPSNEVAEGGRRGSEDIGLVPLASSQQGQGQQYLPSLAESPDTENNHKNDENQEENVDGGENGQKVEHLYPDDATSAVTEKEDGDEVGEGDWIGEEIPLRAYDPETDEIHNLHTHWSVIRLRFREPLAELLAVTVQLTLGFCSDLVITTSSSVAGNETSTDWAWGLSTMVGIYIAGGISGAHLNPAISIMLYIFRGFPLRKVPIFVFAQLLGAFIAGLIAFGLYQRSILEYDLNVMNGATLGKGGTMVAFITYPRYDWINGSTAFFNEFVGTAILSIAVLALGDDTNSPPGAGMSAFIIGLLITVLSMAFGYQTGAALNPARDLGPRLALWCVGYGRKNLFDENAYWIWGPWLGTISGAIIGAILYDGAIFVGGESPVNYPRKRIGRAGKKWRRKWGGRVRNVFGRRGVKGRAGEGGAYSGVTGR